ncbi:hypothetical protein AM493_19745 [Flavobacterium akiainvivens]|uniref:DUF4421 domain-containing protein n=2 Tax=Flavobacterium akiainvivens TaxID=1202724 RepID=A0A0M8MC14_9FLAO|nr:hypothetical protein AM493_19745 [Flavobacterium akiainvivens]SFQ62213.1 protein of unknown function [Flavobacterium akiainvivens]
MPLFCFSQADSAYVAPYPQKFMATGFVANNLLMLTHGEKEYSPNSPLIVGAGFSIKNTIVSVRFSQGVANLQGSEYGKTRITDFQLHNYGRKFITDVFIQNYRGFYNEGSAITLYPDLRIRQIGAEGSYLFNGGQFSAKAAFEQRERQLLSAGSWVLGGGVYLLRLESGAAEPFIEGGRIDNLQFGANGGYAYSWVVNEHWQLSGIATAGLSLGHDLGSGDGASLKVYPTALARGAASYSKNNWAVAFTTIINNRLLYASGDEDYTITSIGFQLSYVRHFDRLFK